MTSSTDARTGLPSLTTVIAVGTAKGGNGKTSVAANLAALLATNGWKVLAIAVDPSDDLGEEFGYYHRGESDHGAALAAALLHTQPLTPTLRDVRPGLDVICAGRHLEDAAVELTRSEAPPTVLADALLPLAPDYDFVVLDCPPGHKLLQRIAFCAARWILVTTGPDLSSRKNIGELAVEAAAAREHNPSLELLAVLLFNIPAGATRIRADVRSYIETELDGIAPVLNTSIRTAVAAGVASRDRGVVMHELAQIPQPRFWEIRRKQAEDAGIPASAAKVAEDYMAAIEEMLEIMAARKEQQR